MTRVDTVIDITTRLAALRAEATELGLALTAAIHDLDRPTLDALPGNELHFAADEHDRAFWVKTHDGIGFYTHEPEGEHCDDRR